MCKAQPAAQYQVLLSQAKCNLGSISCCRVLRFPLGGDRLQAVFCPGLLHWSPVKSSGPFGGWLGRVLPCGTSPVWAKQRSSCPDQPQTNSALGVRSIVRLVPPVWGVNGRQRLVTGRTPPSRFNRRGRGRVTQAMERNLIESPPASDRIQAQRKMPSICMQLTCFVVVERWHQSFKPRSLGKTTTNGVSETWVVP